MSSIVTFYSYKGGVGRSMALANVAVLLAQKGLRVLAIDWDLEAPGLESYFSYFPVDIKGDGILRLLINAANGLLINYKDYIWNVDIGDGRSIAFLPSGRDQNKNYSTDLGDFNWEDFFREKGGGQFLEDLRKQWLADFDIVLIDSRTGLTDSGGICTILLPDIIIAMFTANSQSLYGVRDVLRLAQSARQKLAYDRMPLTILPVPSRFGTRAEFKVSQEWLDLFHDALKEFYIDWLPRGIEPKKVLQQIKIPQVDYFGFGEKLAVVEQGVSDPEGMGFIYNKIGNLLAGDFKDVVNVLEGIDEPQYHKEERILTSTPRKEDYKYDVFVSYAKGRLTFDIIRDLVSAIKREMTLYLEDFQVFFDASELSLGDDLDENTRLALRYSKLLLVIATPVYFSTVSALIEWETFNQRSDIVGRSLIIPVLLRSRDPVPSWFKKYFHLDFTKYTLTAGSKPRTKDYARELRSLTENIAGSLNVVPLFNDKWPIASMEDVKKLIVPKTSLFSTKRTYAIMPGDTLDSIAVRFGTTVDVLSQLNDISNPDLISAGQILSLPD